MDEQERKFKEETALRKLYEQFLMNNPKIKFREFTFEDWKKNGKPE